MGGGWSAPRPGRFTPGKDPVPIVQEAGWAPGPVWTAAENLAPTGIRSPNRPPRSESLYRLSYPNPRTLPLVHLVTFHFTLFTGNFCVLLNNLNIKMCQTSKFRLSFRENNTWYINVKCEKCLGILKRLVVSLVTNQLLSDVCVLRARECFMPVFRETTDMSNITSSTQF